MSDAPIYTLFAVFAAYVTTKYAMVSCDVKHAEGRERCVCKRDALARSLFARPKLPRSHFVPEHDGRAYIQYRAAFKEFQSDCANSCDTPHPSKWF